MLVCNNDSEIMFCNHQKYLKVKSSQAGEFNIQGAKCWRPSLFIPPRNPGWAEGPGKRPRRVLNQLLRALGLPTAGSSSARRQLHQRLESEPQPVWRGPSVTASSSEQGQGQRLRRQLSGTPGWAIPRGLLFCVSQTVSRDSLYNEGGGESGASTQEMTF